VISAEMCFRQTANIGVYVMPMFLLSLSLSAFGSTLVVAVSTMIKCLLLIVGTYFGLS
jgi:hypothetical protein